MSTPKEKAYARVYYKKNKERILARQKTRRPERAKVHRAYYERIKETHPDRILGMTLRRYSLSSDEYRRLFASQHGLCAICENPEKSRRLAVDHDHETGKVRGLLCIGCNTILGHAKDDPARLMKAITYLVTS